MPEPPPPGERPFDRILAEAARIVRAGWPARDEPRLLAIGWATVDLDRAGRELAGLVGGFEGSGFVDAAPDPLLGATCRLARPVRSPTAPGPSIALLEPSAEGRLAAFLARFGEGVAAVYVDAAQVAARPASPPPVLPPGPTSDGPLGPARLMPGAPRWGPYLLVLAESQPPSSTPGDRVPSRP